MAQCNHVKCRNKPVCGQVSKSDKKNPGGNIYTSGQIHTHKHHKLYGWHSQEESQFYNSQVKNINNGIIVEIGVYGGASLLGIIDSCKQTNSHIYGIDPWEKIESANGVSMRDIQRKIYREKIKKIRLHLENIIKVEKYNKYITLIHDFSQNVVNNFKDNSIDILFIDGDHSYESVYNDLLLWLPKVKKNGIIWGDDFSWVSVRMAVQDFCHKYDIKMNQICKNRAWKIVK